MRQEFVTSKDFDYVRCAFCAGPIMLAAIIEGIPLGFCSRYCRDRARAAGITTCIASLPGPSRAWVPHGSEGGDEAGADNG